MNGVYVKTLTLPSGHDSREKIRDFVVRDFLKGLPGTGNGENATTYEYEVEKTLSGLVVFLRRPAILNFGFDFKVRVRGFNFNSSCGSENKRRTDAPSHKHIVDDLIKKKQTSVVEFKRYRDCIDDVFQCKPLSCIELPTFGPDGEHDPDLMLYLLKWLFIEQDVTYWNYSLRGKLKSHLDAVQ